jgi:hypothetical protein
MFLNRQTLSLISVEIHKETRWVITCSSLLIFLIPLYILYVYHYYYCVCETVLFMGKDVWCPFCKWLCFVQNCVSCHSEGEHVDGKLSSSAESYCNFSVICKIGTKFLCIHIMWIIGIHVQQCSSLQKPVNINQNFSKVLKDDNTMWGHPHTALLHSLLNIRAALSRTRYLYRASKTALS